MWQHASYKLIDFLFMNALGFGCSSCVCVSVSVCVHRTFVLPRAVSFGCGTGDIYFPFLSLDWRPWSRMGLFDSEGCCLVQALHVHVCGVSCVMFRLCCLAFSTWFVEIRFHCCFQHFYFCACLSLKEYCSWRSVTLDCPFLFYCM